MQAHALHPSRHNAFALRFAGLARGQPGYAFPCDATGRVDLDALSARARLDYFFARSLIGRDFAPPALERCDATAPRQAASTLGRTVQ